MSFNESEPLQETTGDPLRQVLRLVLEVKPRTRPLGWFVPAMGLNGTTLRNISLVKLHKLPVKSLEP